MFSHRLPPDLEPNPLTARCRSCARRRAAHRSHRVEPDDVRVRLPGGSARRASRTRAALRLRAAAARPRGGPRGGRRGLRAPRRRRSPRIASSSPRAPARATRCCSSCCAIPATRCSCPRRAIRCSSTSPRLDGVTRPAVSARVPRPVDTARWTTSARARGRAHARRAGRQPEQPDRLDR